MKEVALVLIFFFLLFTSGCTQVITSTYIRYDVTPSVVRNSNYNDENNLFTTVVYRSGKNLVDYNSPVLRFTLTPDIPTVRSREEYSYIFFEVVDFDKSIIKSASGIYNLKWTDIDDNLIWMVSGEKRVYINEVIDLRLNISLNPYRLVEISGSEFSIVFYNYDRSWTEMYTFKLICIDF